MPFRPVVFGMRPGGATILSDAINPIPSDPVTQPNGPPETYQMFSNYVADVLEYATYLKLEVGVPIRVASCQVQAYYLGDDTDLDGDGDANVALRTRVRNAIAAADAAGIMIFAATGNDGGCPMDASFADIAEEPQVVAISNSTWAGTLLDGSSGSNCGPPVDFTAPGSQVLTTFPVGTGDPLVDPSGDYGTHICGTSFSTPMVAAVAALMFSYDSTLTPAEVYEAMMATADDVGPPGWDEQYGHGRVNAYRALLYVATGGAGPHLPGDVNNSRTVDVADVVATLAYIFEGTVPSGFGTCVLDMNEDGSVDVADPIHLVNYLFNGGAEVLIGCPVPAGPC